LHNADKAPTRADRNPDSRDFQAVAPVLSGIASMAIRSASRLGRRWVWRCSAPTRRGHSPVCGV